MPDYARTRGKCLAGCSYPAWGVSLGGPGFARLAMGVSRATDEGNPSAPCLKMEHPATFRVPWAVRAGQRRVAVSVKQASNISPRPALIVRANSALGVSSDVVEVAGGSTGWVTVGPVVVNPTSDGVLVVELVCRAQSAAFAPCYWDHLVFE